MNVIYMHTHDSGRFIQPYGYALDTPNLMQLAQEGTLFRQAFNGAPTCSPSRACLLTGMWAHSNGMLGLAHRGFRLNDYDQHLARYLGKQGWQTVLIGVQHEAASAETIGYDQVLNSRGEASRITNSTERDLANAKQAADFLQSYSGDKPFFLSFGMINTHREFPEIDDDINPDYTQPPFPLFDNDANRRDMAAYHSSVRVVDRCVGMVLDALRRSGYEHDTLLIFTTDHGIAFPKMKCNLFDTGIGVSLIMKFPGNKLAGQACDALVSQIDLFPTICDLADIPQPEWLQGHSLLPLFDGANQVRSELFAEVTYHAAYEPMRCVRTERYKYIRLFDQDHQGYVPANIDDSLSKSFLLDHGLLALKREQEMLFDLYHDPVERVNLIDNPQYQEVAADMRDRLHNWMVETSDPLLQGRVPKPAGAQVNKLTCISPKTEDWE